LVGDVGGLHAAQNSHAATDGGFIPGGRRSKALSHTHSGTPDIRTAVRCDRDIATYAAERPAMSCNDAVSDAPTRDALRPCGLSVALQTAVAWAPVSGNRMVT
jgi:hypothetical protein